MARVKRKPVIPNSIKSAGLTHRFKQGKIICSKEPDEDNPKQSLVRFRVKESYQSLKMITDYQKKLALRYALLVERAEGATPDTFANVNLCSVGRNSWEPTHAQFQAYEELIKVNGSVGKYHVSILKLIIMENMDCKEVAECKGFSQYYVAGVVMSAFIKLEEAFEEVDNVIAR